MGVFDKFLDMMKLNDDEEYEDDFYDEDEDDNDDYEEKPRRSFFGKKNKDVYDDSDAGTAAAANKNANRDSKVTPIRGRSAVRKGGNMEVCVINPKAINDSKDITMTLLSGRTVILNLEELNKIDENKAENEEQIEAMLAEKMEISQRIIDFVGGAAYAINGSLLKISRFIFVLTPPSVDISGDIQNLLNETIEASDIKDGF